MSVVPVVRYMILCDDWGPDPGNPRRLNVYGLISHIHALDDPPYPLLHHGFCVLLMLTGGRGTGDAQIICVSQDTGQRVFATAKQSITFGPDPLAVGGLSFRVRDCLFPFPGLYSVQFWYNNVLVEERPLLLR
jgi:hypothetical protein